MNSSISAEKQFYFQWHFLNSCNLRCKHCYQNGYCADDLDLETLKKIADEIFRVLDQWGMYGRISLTGGEPFFSENLHPLFEYLDKSERIISIDVLTNGTCVTNEDIERLKQYNKLHQIQISPDGGTAECHDLIRGIGSFDKAINTIRRLKKNGIEVALMYTLMEQNKHDYERFIDTAIREKVDAFTVERVTPCGNGVNQKLLSADEVRDIYKNITLIANGMLDKPVIRRARPLWINTLCDSSRSDCIVGGFCPVGLTSLAILHDGTVLPCRRLEIPIGNVLSDGLYKIWYTSDVLWNIRDKNNLKGKCHGCKNLAYCGGCRAIAYAVTGDYMEEDPQCWMEQESLS